MMPSFLLCLFLLSFLFMTNKVMLLLDLVLNKKVPFLETLVLYFSLFPFILSMTIPMSMMVGTLLAFGRLSSDMEVTAFKSSGVHLFHLIAPVLALGLVLTGCMVFFNDKVLPAANFAFKQAEFKILQKQANLAIREKIWIDKFENYRFYIDHQESDGSFTNIKAFNRWSPNQPLLTTVARTGTLDTNPESHQISFHLSNGIMSWDNTTYNTFNQLYFQTETIPLKLEGQLTHLSDIKKDYEEMDLGEIARAIPLEKDGGRYNYLRTEYQKRLSLPFACLVLAWFSASLGLWTRSKGFMGFILGLVLIFVYYLMFIFGQTLSNQGTVSPVVGLWGADFVLGLAGFLVYYLVVAEQSAFRALPRAGSRGK